MCFFNYEEDEVYVLHGYLILCSDVTIERTHIAADKAKRRQEVHRDQVLQFSRTLNYMLCGTLYCR